jgi:hypothetical protein
MSIITTAVAVPSRLFSIYNLLFASEGGEDRERIIALATPPALSSRGAHEEGEGSSKLLGPSLGEARKLGMIEEEADGNLRITELARTAGRRGDTPEQRFRAFMRQTLFDTDRSAEAQQSSFMLAMVWFLGMDPFTPPSFSAEQQVNVKLEVGDHASKLELTSQSRYQNFAYWARYLGFAAFVGTKSDRRVVPDPLDAIDGALGPIFSAERRLSVEGFLGRLAAIYPVFESGAARIEYDSLRSRADTNGGASITAATSLGLQRLADRGRLKLTSVADAQSRILNLGHRQARISHVELARAA